MRKTKEALRRELLPLRRTSAMTQLTANDIKSREFFSAHTVFCYISAHGEVGTHTLIETLLKDKTVVVPYCTDSVGNMICVQIHSMEDLEEGRFGIPQPKYPVEFPKDKIDFAIVPGIAFDKEGYRLGYGKGYYDRFLSDISSYKLGVCQELFYLETVPHDEYDIRMDKVIRIK